jgi:hypothetical protein
VRHATVVTASISWNYTTVLDLVFGTVSVLLVVVFASTGGVKMMRHMKQMDAPSHGHG